MTIAIAISISEGLILAADSRTTRRAGTGEAQFFEVLTDRARKVFSLSRLTAAATHGRSHVSRRTIASLVSQFKWARPVDAPEDVETVIGEFSSFLNRASEDELRASETAPGETHDKELGFLIGGYGADGTGKIYELRFPERESRLLSTTDAPNYHWRGQGDAISRLMKGIDPRLHSAHLTLEGVPQLEYAVKLRHMSLHDGVDFARLLGDIAIGIDRFTAGTFGEPTRHPVVGGHLMIATVTIEGISLVQAKGSR